MSARIRQRTANIPPAGFNERKYPLHHKLIASFGLSAITTTQNTCLLPLIMGSTDLDVAADTIQVNPHNTNYEEDGGPLCRQNSIIDDLTLSLKFNMTDLCNSGEIISTVFGDGLKHLNFLWRPIMFSFPEKLTAADDDTGTTVATILALTSDDTNEDVVPITTSKLPTTGASDLSLPVSTVNAVQVFGDFNMTTDTTMEDHVWDENLFQNAMRRFTNKGALKACVGRTRYVHLTDHKPYQKFFIRKFVPRSVRRIVDRTFMGIQVHVPTETDVESDYRNLGLTASSAHLGCKVICHYNEWNNEHLQERVG